MCSIDSSGLRSFWPAAEARSRTALSTFCAHWALLCPLDDIVADQSSTDRNPVQAVTDAARAFI